MVEYNRMKLTPKQILGQQILAHHTAIKIRKLTLMYTPKATNSTQQMSSIIVSIAKKITPKATARNYIKRVLRAITRQTLEPTVFKKYNWLWICKEPAISAELRKDIISTIAKLNT